MGSIRLRLNAEVTRLVSDATTAKGLWEALKELYGTTSAMGTFSVRTRAVRGTDGVEGRFGEVRWYTARGVRTSAKLLATL